MRYRRPVTVVVAEIDGLSRLVDRFGAEPARRVLPAVGDAMRRHARRTDQVAHVGGGRFLVLLPETDEVAAINYVERVRMACERWLESGAVALHLAIGWASPTQVGEVDTAMRVAEERMYAERRARLALGRCGGRAGLLNGGGTRGPDLPASPSRHAWGRGRLASARRPVAISSQTTGWVSMIGRPSLFPYWGR